MPQPHQLHLEPHYGWGWTGTARNPARETPRPFDIRSVVAERGSWQGIVSTSGHEFEGMTVALSQHHYRWDGVVNVSVRDGDRLVTQGWAGVDGYAALAGQPFTLRRRFRAAEAGVRNKLVMLKNLLRRY